jgi:hypothetical protein|tara:strand:- start:1447 stop:1569 length:123 start_codon:yes stop_codon:yes gene_type:complete
MSLADEPGELRVAKEEVLEVEAILLLMMMGRGQEGKPLPL